MATDPVVVSKYAAGYSQCATEVSRYLSRLEGFSPDVRNRLVNHLTGCVHKISPAPAQTAAITCGNPVEPLVLPQTQQTLSFQFPSISTRPQDQPLDLALGQLPTAQPQTIPSIGSAAATTLLVNSTPNVASVSNVPVMPIQLIPAKLPSGDTVYILANTQTLSTANIVSSPPSTTSRVPTATITSPPNVTTATATSPASPPPAMVSVAPSTSIAIVPPQIQTTRLSNLSSPPLPSPEVQIIKPETPPGLQLLSNLNAAVFPRPTPVIEHRVQPEIRLEQRLPEVRVQLPEPVPRQQEVPVIAAPPAADHNNNHQVALPQVAQDQAALEPMWRPWWSLLWRHNGCDGVSNHQHHYCLLNRLFRRRSKQTSKLRITGLCAGNSLGTGEFPAQMASYAENISIWWRHHVLATAEREISLCWNCRHC